MAANAEEVTAGAAYRDSRGNRLAREIVLSPDRLVCRDTLEGAFDFATLRWRLPPGDWQLTGNRLHGPGMELEVTVSRAEPAFTLSRDREARDYARLAEVVVLEVTVDRPCHIETRIRF